MQSYNAQSLPQKDLFYIKEKADPDRAETPHSNKPPHVYVTMWKYLHNAAQMFKGVVSVTAVVLMQPCQGDVVCLYAKAKALYLFIIYESRCN